MVSEIHGIIFHSIYAEILKFQNYKTETESKKKSQKPLKFDHTNFKFLYNKSVPL